MYLKVLNVQNVLILNVLSDWLIPNSLQILHLNVAISPTHTPSYLFHFSSLSRFLPQLDGQTDIIIIDWTAGEWL